MPEHTRHNVAIVDDDEAVRDSLRVLLEVVGHSVETFASGAEFLVFDHSDLSCLVLDHRMPQMTGLELAEKLHAAGVDLPILLVTGSPSPTIVARATEIGIAGVLEKPPADDEILDFIEATRP